jgi:hypothetical protein
VSRQRFGSHDGCFGLVSHLFPDQQTDSQCIPSLEQIVPAFVLEITASWHEVY